MCCNCIGAPGVSLDRKSTIRKSSFVLGLNSRCVSPGLFAIACAIPRLDSALYKSPVMVSFLRPLNSWKGYDDPSSWTDNSINNGKEAMDCNMEVVNHFGSSLDIFLEGAWENAQRHKLGEVGSPRDTGQILHTFNGTPQQFPHIIPDEYGRVIPLSRLERQLAAGIDGKCSGMLAYDGSTTHKS
jgi:hypothetical protein